MAVAVMPEEPDDRWGRIISAILAGVVVVVAVLLVVSLLLAYVF